MEINFAKMTTFEEVELALLALDKEGRLNEVNGDALLALCRSLFSRSGEVDKKWDALKAKGVDPVLRQFASDLTHAESVFQLLQKTNVSQENADWIEQKLPTIKEYVALHNAQLKSQYDMLSLLHNALKQAEEQKQIQKSNSGCLSVFLVMIVAGISMIGTVVHLLI